jgi:phosphoribosylformimino-5-aminoimidazole carboxamide ribotide isomerase
MEIIPVIDILNGIVVHAVRGEREKYKPIKSILSTSPNPVEIANAFKKILNLKKLYIADLNAILRRGNNYETIKEIYESTGLEIMVDMGVSDISSARRIFKYNISELIIGTETLKELNFIEECLQAFGSDKIIISLDTKNGKVLGPPEIEEKRPKEVFMMLQDLGIKKIILLDLGRVGSEMGPNLDILDSLLEVSKKNVEIMIGGGVRNIKDIIEIKKRNIYGVLVATSLHNGNITRKDIENLKKDEKILKN